MARKIALWVLLLCSCRFASAAAEPLIINIMLNGMAKGDLEARVDADIYWLDADALKGMGLSEVKGSSQLFSGRRFVRMDQISGVKANLDLDLLQASLQAEPALLPLQISNFSQQNHIRPWEGGTSAYLNYTVSARRDASGQTGMGFAPTLNIASEGWNLRSRHDYQSHDQGWLRLDSTLSYDSPDQMMRITLGDLSPTAGALGRGVPMAGIGVSRVFSMQPYFETKPGLNGGAPITSPSTAEIYINGVIVKNVDLQPGMYQFQDLSYFSGFQDIAVVVKDQYGNRQVYNLPYYFDDSLLKSGLNEFNYNLGAERKEGFDHYQGLAFSGLHRYGVSDYLTVGVRAERTPGYQSAGALANLRLGDYGVLGVAASWAKNGGEQGQASLFNYRYEEQAFNVRAMLQQQSAHYLASMLDLPVPAWNGSVGFGFGNQSIGNWGVDLMRQAGGTAETANALRLSFSASPARDFSVSTSFSIRNNGSQGFVNLTWLFDGNQSAGTSFQRDEFNQQRMNAYYAKNTPAGEGWSYRFNAEHDRIGSSQDAYVQGRFAQSQLTASARQYAGRSSYSVAAEGAVAYVDGHWGVSRPINQSFALVQSEGLSGVGVTQNSQLIGHTDEEGYLWVPELSNYGQQQIALVQDDIPIEYTLPKLRLDVMPGQNMGRHLVFAAKKLRAFEARIVDAQQHALVNTTLSLKLPEGDLSAMTDINGKIYLEDIAPGKYAFEIQNKGLPCSAWIEVPDAAGDVLDLGDLICSRE
ncbi:fimbria/pilus outer membrane usher protein [Iodobacter fluviatilis]|uniref:F1 capsule-anchoring protein n=1 Tax=Iodobacter fluviatilis TaxID=537 RepID=A0A377Q9G0_9NEIS|nr:fimbria/pilus outer membrane usher protein [Iodobacter fluviatilis]TCU88472.1 outer membrane usher protein FimD/PapC [Iodobacter fluviatilis]STQ91457.1 F1 capsule-anchoring protein precursor [Iodobacter fluviatilis]